MNWRGAEVDVVAMTSLSLRDDEIHAWFAFVDRSEDRALLERYREIMTSVEREQEGRFYFQRDRVRYAITRALVRSVLSRYAGLAPAEWCFANDDYGRPRILNDTPLTQDLSFNVSHAGNLIVVAIARKRMLGVDIENVRKQSVSIDLADKFFAREEAAALVQLPTEQRQRRFFEYWTLKESYIKARGMGLSIPLDQFSFDLSHPRTVDLAINASQGDLAARWQFWQLEPASEYLCAICFERREGESPRLLAREVIPMSEERTLSYVLWRASGDLPTS